MKKCLFLVVMNTLIVSCVSGCLAPQTRSGELFLATKRQFRLVHEACHANDSRMNPLAILAPFVIVGGGFLGVTYAPVADTLCIPYDLIMRADPTEIIVVDELGNPAQGVRVNMELSEDIFVDGETDAHGKINTCADLRQFTLREYSAVGSGYYGSDWRLHRYDSVMGVDSPKINGDNEIIIRVKRICNPVPMAYGRIQLPKKKEDAPSYYDFDCEYGDWVSPYGLGKIPDLRVETYRSGAKENWSKDAFRTNVLTITALGEGNGFMLRKNDITISLGSDLRVPSSAVFPLKQIQCLDVYDDKGGYLNSESRRFEWCQYYIMRLRSSADGSGLVQHARYGKMTFVQGSGCIAETYLNEVADERSLEAVRTEKNPAYVRWKSAGGKRRQVHERINRP